MPSRSKSLAFPAAVISLAAAGAAGADWPAVRGGPERTGLSREEVRGPFRIEWAAHWKGERMSSCLEPILLGGKVIAATHSGSIHALDAASGEPVWTFRAGGAFLHSPAAAGELVVAGSTDGFLHAVELRTGKPAWSWFERRGGFAASPVIAEGAAILGSRTGSLVAIDLASGKLLWRRDHGAPFRQTAAAADGRVFVTGEDLVVRCLETRSGKEAWTSRRLEGQSARDYYPVIHRSGARTLLIIRTSPAVQMSDRIARDRRVLCEAAGADASDWRKLDAWLKSDAARPNEERLAREEAAILRHIAADPGARTLFVFDAATGEELPPAPVLWCGGCQGVGTPPTALPDGRLLVLLRSAYGNWNHGVAPLVALGALDPAGSRLSIFEHRRGSQPPWNTFWGTADESQNFIVAGSTVVIVHQSTLSGFDLATRDLFPIAGERDGWGGFRNLPWALNEWNGPARGGVAVAGGRLYWQTGSRLLCIGGGAAGREAGKPGKPPKPEDLEIDPLALPASEAPRASISREDLEAELAARVDEAISRRWAPLCLEPGLAGRQLFFASSGDVFEALSLAFPHLPAALRERVKTLLAGEWEVRPPFTPASAYPLDEGDRREHFREPGARVARELLSRHGFDKPPHPFGGLPSVLLYAERCEEWERVIAAWPRIETAFEEFSREWKPCDPERGDLHAVRHLGALLAFRRVAERAGDADSARKASALGESAAEAVAAWCRRSASRLSPRVFRDIGEWDSFIGKGDALFFRIIPHRSRPALFHGLTQESAKALLERAPDAARAISRAVGVLCPTWHLAGEERQVHYGENLVDPPDLGLDLLKALVWIEEAPFAEIARRVDVPCCRADLTHIARIAIALGHPSAEKR